MIDKLSDQEKSVMLARAMGWEVSFAYSPAHPQLWLPDDLAKAHKTKFIANLYDPASMALAWRVLNHMGDLGYDALIEMWFSSEEVPSMEPKEAQAAWLDYALDLAIEAGIVDDD